MAEAERELGQRRFRRMALEQEPDAGGEAGAVGAGLAVDQRRFGHGAVDLRQAQDAVAVRRAAALEGRVHMDQAERGRFRAAQPVGAAIGALAAEVDDGAEAEAAGGVAELPGQRVVGAVKASPLDGGPIAPAEAERPHGPRTGC